MTLGDLRKMGALEQVAKRCALTVIGESSLSEQSTSDSGSSASRRKSRNRKRRNRRKKSGKTLKASSHVVKQEYWPHFYLAKALPGSTDKSYDELSIAEFVAGYT